MVLVEERDDGGKKKEKRPLKDNIEASEEIALLFV